MIVRAEGAVIHDLSSILLIVLDALIPGFLLHYFACTASLGAAAAFTAAFSHRVSTHAAAS